MNLEAQGAQHRAEAGLDAMAVRARQACAIVGAGLPTDLAGLYGAEAALSNVMGLANQLDRDVEAFYSMVLDAIKAQGGIVGGEDNR
jgi:hypothetical protein